MEAENWDAGYVHVHYEYVNSLKELFTRKAKVRHTISFSELFSLFDEKVKKPDIYQTMEFGCGEIAPREIAIYEALLAKKSDGLPGSGFFDIFRNRRSEDYRKIAPAMPYPNRLSLEEQQAITLIERERVYEHAAKLNK